LKIEGIIPPLVTPFREDGRLDLPAFEANFDVYSEHGLGGYLVLGSNGEAAVLEEEEKLALVSLARARSDGRLVVAGTGLESTRATIALTLKAADRGADAALVLTPHYYKARMTPDALRRHFEAVAEASPIPILAYSVPAVTGLLWPVALSAALAEHPRIAGMKESSGDVGLLGRIVAAAPRSFRVICGSGPVLYPALCVGASAGILAVACCAPGPAVALYEAWKTGDHARARRIHEGLVPLATAVTSTYGVAGLKQAMTLAGFKGGQVRAPLLPVSAEASAELRDLLPQAEAAAVV
jgi:4-hydroxy-2-oxoglutarate aldolase